MSLTRQEKGQCPFRDVIPTFNFQKAFLGLQILKSLVHLFGTRTPLLRTPLHL